MLNSLENIERDEAKLVLSKLVDKFLPTAFDKPYSAHDNLQQIVIDELFASLEIQKENIGARDVTRILKRLHNEITELTYNESQKEEIKTNLGASGILLVGQYDAKIHPQVRSSLRERCISASEVTDTMHHPIAFIHLDRGKEAEDPDALFSLYAKKYKFRNKYFYLLVGCKREGYVLDVIFAWKIFTDDIGDFVDLNIIELLERFVDKFGIKLRIGNSIPRKLYVYEAIPFLIGHDHIEMYQQDVEKEHTYLQHVSLKINTLVSVLEVSLGFTIDMTKYLTALQAHGLKVKMPS